MKYRNPIIAGFAADPSICRVGEDYYMVHSTFEYLPGLPVLHSKDLVNWEIIGYAIHRAEQMQFSGMKCSEGLYAPTIRFHDGIFYVVCTNVSMDGNFYVTASDPAGPWSDPIWVKQGGIDPSLFFDDDGKVYFTSNGWEDKDGHTVAFIQQAEMDIATGDLLTEPVRICYGTGGRCLEAPHLYHVNDWYYLVCAEGGTDLRHMATVFRSKSPWGPFESHPNNPVLTARDEGAPTLSAVGHADLFEDKYGQYWMVFLCYRTVGKYHHLGRETGMVPIDWSNGWPVAVGGKAPDTIIDCPDRKGVAELLPVMAEELDDFSSMDHLGLKWNFLREYFADYRLSRTEKKGLVLKGNSHTLDELATPAWIGRRQQHFRVKCNTSVVVGARNDNEEAGLSVVCSNRAWYAIMVSVRNGKRAVVLKKRAEDMQMEIVRTLPDTMQDVECPIELYVDADEQIYYFGFLCNGEKHCVGSGMAKLLSTEVNWGFTGVFIGMYAVETEAFFEYFRYVGLA